MNTYHITRIEEPDFGCEGRPEGQEIKDKVFLKEDLEYDQMSLKEYIDPFTGEPVNQNK